MNRNCAYLFVVASLFAGCGGVINTTVIPSANQYKYDNACVIGLPEASSEVGVAVKNSLGRKGIQAVLISDQKDCTADVRVAYLDTWWWDVVSYLKALELQLHDNKTNALIAYGRYDTRAFHGYPAPDNVCDDIFTSIFDKINKKQ